MPHLETNIYEECLLVLTFHSLTWLSSVGELIYKSLILGLKYLFIRDCLNLNSRSSTDNAGLDILILFRTVSGILYDIFFPSVPAVLLVCVLSFNVDQKNGLSFSGPLEDMFGYTVQQFENSEGKWWVSSTVNVLAEIRRFSPLHNFLLISQMLTKTQAHFRHARDGNLTWCQVGNISVKPPLWHKSEVNARRLK